ncbi:DUF6624 domain-containing protein [Pedobacter heparinus]|uniref:DUF6624 domain-containing protein n=1 Tax=Pedobacter heparinus TaxID=984 RepID=UPI00292DCC86|nr:DUF6624 domain-containing protein [Pedobacter heparinus]
MKFIKVIFFLLLLTLTGFAQSVPEYETLISKASLYHLQHRPKEGIACYEKAFKLQSPDALNAYKAAGMYALDKNIKKSYVYLNLALDKGWTEADWLTADPYFKYLKNTDSISWKAILHRAYDKEREYEKNLKLPELRKRINLLIIKDQQLRYLQINNKNSANVDSIRKAIAQSDNYNRKEAKQIIQKFGWPKMSAIGKDGANNLWLIVQHSDEDIIFQKQVLTLMAALQNTKEVNMENYAYLYDRVQCGLNYRQLYGTQVVWSTQGTAKGFRPIIYEHTIDQRRKSCGMATLKSYALTYGFNYFPISKSEAAKNELIDKEKVRHLMDSAIYYYENQLFQKVYEVYNAAAEIQGGMSNKDNYKAALQCARVARITGNKTFTDIALDFLMLLHKRGILSPNALLKEKNFNPLHKEKRWLTIIHAVSII